MSKYVKYYEQGGKGYTYIRQSVIYELANHKINIFF